MFRFIKKLLILVLISTVNSLKCISLKNQECKVRKVIIDNNYMTFPHKIKVDKCVGSCNDKDDPYFKFSTPEIVKNISVKVFDLISQNNVLKNIPFHKKCKSDCSLDEKVCNNKQKWNKTKCRWECLEIKECNDNSSWYVVNCRCDFKKAAASKLITTEECDVEIDGIVQNKTTTLIKRIQNCKPFVASSILFVSVSIILTGIMIYFCLQSSVLPYLNYFLRKKLNSLNITNFKIF